MKIIRLFVGFVVISLIIGIGSAFNGQTVSQIDNVDESVSEKVGLPEITSVDEKTDVIDNQLVEEKKEKETKNTTDNTVKSSEKKQTNKNPSTNQVKEQKTTQNNQNNNDSNSNETPNNVNNSQVIETPKEEKTNNDNTSNDEQFNAMYYSITHGNAEYSTLEQCNSVGYKIKDKELDEVLDWNENNPDNLKQPIIKAHWCYEVMKNGKINYFLHFITETGANMDSELKSKYK